MYFVVLAAYVEDEKPSSRGSLEDREKDTYDNVPLRTSLFTPTNRD
jgi:hypothetical protein